VSSLETVLYEVAGPVATITLNRPDALNTSVPPMPDEVASCVGSAVRDPGVKVIAQVHGWCIGGGSDFALSCDLVVASEDAVVGTPYSRVWGAYLSGMWIYRLGLARCKWHALTGRPLSGREAADVELINAAVPFAALEERVASLAGELASIPSWQLAAMKLVVNHAYENMGVASTQTLGPILDGLMRNTREAREWVARAERDGVRAVVEARDAPFGDYSQAPPERRPDPRT
jgi:enoyl-CoA hydratase